MNYPYLSKQKKKKVIKFGNMKFNLKIRTKHGSLDGGGGKEKISLSSCYTAVGRKLGAGCHHLSNHCEESENEAPLGTAECVCVYKRERERERLREENS